MLSYYVIYCEKFRKILQPTEKVALTKGQAAKGVNHLTSSQLTKGQTAKCVNHLIPSQLTKGQAAQGMNHLTHSS